MNSQPDDNNASSPTESSPPQGVRTLVNFLLFVHLFSLAALLLLNGSFSGLRYQLRRVPGYYLQVLGMDYDFDSGQRFNYDLQSSRTTRRLNELAEQLKYVHERGFHEAEKIWTEIADAQKQNPRDMGRRGLFHLTHADALDVGHFLELRFVVNGDAQLARLPELRTPWPQQRYLRYQMLAREVARLAGDDNNKDMLPVAITGAVLKRNGLSPADLADIQPEFRCARLTTVSWMDAPAASNPQAAPRFKDPFHDDWFQTAYKRIPVSISGQIQFMPAVRLDSGERDFNKRDYAPPVAVSSKQ
jgi:hypothetical protein